MCGVSGVISLGAQLKLGDRSEIKKLSQLLSHRGPDQIGTFENDNIIFINNRLKINDFTSKSDLPFFDIDQKIILAYNGEITNFKELDKKYKLSEKYKFNPNSDTQVLFYLYKEIGLSFLEQISGMYSIVIYNKDENKVYLIRDRYGITPLFYLIKNNLFYFSSELKLLYKLKNFNSKINKNAINHFFSLAYIPGEMTPFEGLHEVDKSQIITLDVSNNKISKHKYYQLNYQINESIKEKQAIEISYELLRNSVKRNLTAEATVGSTLSGGLDTSSIVGLAKELGLSKGLKTYSIKMKDSSFDESKYQRLMSEFAGTDHTEIQVGASDVLGALYSSIAHMDEPSGDGAVVPFYILAKHASRDIKALMSGEGGDEVYNAYETHGAYLYRKLYRNNTPGFIRKSMRYVANMLPVVHKKLSHEFLLKRFLNGSELDPSTAHIYWRHPLTDHDKSNIFNSKIDNDLTNKLFKSTFDSINTTEELNKISALDLEHYLYGDLMVKSDRMFYAHSVEGRYPFLDKDLVNFLTTVPTKIKISLRKRRYLQKASMRNTLPREILRRGSFGLEIPNSRWLTADMEHLTKKYFSKDRLADSGLFDIDHVFNLIKEHKEKKRDLGRGLWCLLNFQIWFEMFVKEKNYTDYLSR